MPAPPSLTAPCAPSAAPTDGAAAPAATDGLKIRGTLTIVSAADHDYEFRAQRQTGVSTQEVVSQTAVSKLYRTTGERKPKLVAHLTTCADSADPAADLSEQLARLTKTFDRPATPRLRGRVLLDDSTGLRVTHNQKQQVLECVLRFDLNTTKDLQSTLIKRMQEISTCLAINKTSLAPRKS